MVHQADINNEIFVYKIPDSESGEILPPCDPDTRYPESQPDHLAQKNYVYDAIRQIFYLSGYDKKNYNTPRWNPLGQFISPGETILLKPNLVLHFNRRKNEHYYSVVTHPALIRCMIDYAYIALQGKGRIIVGDAPLNTAKFDILCEVMGLNKIKDMYAKKNFNIELVDFRASALEKNAVGIMRNKASLAHESSYIVVKLGRDSMLSTYDTQFGNFRITEYAGDGMSLHHNNKTHEYFIHKSVFDADVIISLPKIKTHKKAGFTCAMKNFIGINGAKDWLPHHRKGSIEEGGDEYQHKSLRKRVISNSWDVRWKISNSMLQRVLIYFERAVRVTNKLVPFKDGCFEGSWWGNTTISKTINDMNRMVIYCNKEGKLQDKPQRKLLYLVDGIICGEGEGPMECISKRCNTLIWGHNAYAVDLIAATLMGFDINSVDTLKTCRSILKYKIFNGVQNDIQIRTNLSGSLCDVSAIRRLLPFVFVPPISWKGHIEIDENHLQR